MLLLLNLHFVLGQRVHRKKKIITVINVISLGFFRIQTLILLVICPNTNQSNLHGINMPPRLILHNNNKFIAQETNYGF